LIIWSEISGVVNAEKSKTNEQKELKRLGRELARKTHLVEQERMKYA
jgi:hypothetical protein